MQRISVHSGSPGFITDAADLPFRSPGAVAVQDRSPRMVTSLVTSRTGSARTATGPRPGTGPVRCTRPGYAGVFFRLACPRPQAVRHHLTADTADRVFRPPGAAAAQGRSLRMVTSQPPRRRERMDRFEEAVQILHSLLGQPRTTFSGEHFQLQDAPCQPARSRTGAAASRRWRRAAHTAARARRRARRCAGAARPRRAGRAG
jgi:hypothetical protein